MTNDNQYKPTLLINIYNPRDSDLILMLRQYLLQHLNSQDYNNIIIGGDFNLHHPLWNPQNYTAQDDQADELMEMMANHNLRLLLPSGTITYPTATGGTTIDLVWGNEKAEENLLKCQISTDNDHGSNHLPVRMILDIQPQMHLPSLSTSLQLCKNRLEDPRN